MWVACDPLQGKKSEKPMQRTAPMLKHTEHWVAIARQRGVSRNIFFFFTGVRPLHLVRADHEVQQSWLNKRHILFISKNNWRVSESEAKGKLPSGNVSRTGLHTRVSSCTTDKQLSNLSMAMAPHAPVDPGCFFHSHKHLNEVFKFFLLLDWHSWAQRYTVKYFALP